MAWTSSVRDGERWRGGGPAWAMGRWSRHCGVRTRARFGSSSSGFGLTPAGRAAARVDPGERDAVVDDCLADVAVHLITSAAPAPRSLPAYLARSLRNRVINDLRARARAEPAAARRAVRGNDAIPAGSSEHAVRSSSGRPTYVVVPALLRLAGALEAPLTDEERLLVVWMSRLVPHARDRGLARHRAEDGGQADRASPRAAPARGLRPPRARESDERRELLAFLDRAALAPRPAARLAAVRAVGETP